MTVVFPHSMFRHTGGLKMISLFIKEKKFKHVMKITLIIVQYYFTLFNNHISSFEINVPVKLLSFLFMELLSKANLFCTCCCF